MAIELQQLSQDYQDDHLAQAMYARELEWFHYDFDRQNFKAMLANNPPKELSDDLEKRLADTEKQMRLVEMIYAALRSRITSKERHADAVLRIAKARETKA